MNGAWRIRGLYLLSFLNQIHFFGAVSVPFFLDWLKVGYAQMFILQAWFMFWIFALEIPTGVVADKWGRKWSVGLGALMAVSSHLVFGLTQSYAILFVGEFLGALGVSLISGANKALLYDTIVEVGEKKESRKIQSRFEAIGTIGIVIGFITGSFFVASTIMPYPQSLPFTFILTAGAGALQAILVFLLPEPKRRKTRKDWLRMGIEGVKEVFRHKKLRAFVINSTLISSTTFFMFWFYQPLAGAAQISIGYYGVMAAWFNILGAGLLWNIKHLEKFGIGKILALTAFLPGISFLLLAATQSAIVVIVGTTIVVASKLLRGPILTDFMNKHIKSEERATVLSGVSMLERGIQVIMYPLIGLLADISLSTVMLVLGGLTILFAFVGRIEASALRKH